MAPSMRTGKAAAGRGTLTVDHSGATSTVPMGEDALNDMLGRLHEIYGFHTRPLKPRPTSGSHWQSAAAAPPDRPWILKLKMLSKVDKDGMQEAYDLLASVAGNIGVFGRRRGQLVSNAQRSQLEEAFEEILDGKLDELGDRDISLLPMIGIESTSDPKSEVEATPFKNDKGYRHNRWLENPRGASNPVQINGVSRSFGASSLNSAGKGTAPSSEDLGILSKGRGKGGPEGGNGVVTPLASLVAQRKLKSRGNEFERPKQRQQQQRQKPQAPLKQARKGWNKGQEPVRQAYTERDCNKAHSRSKRQPRPHVGQPSYRQSELEVDDSDTDKSFYSAPSSPVVEGEDNSFPGASQILGSVQQVSHFQASGQKSHERRSTLLGQGKQGKQDILAPTKSTPGKNSDPGSSEPPTRLPFGTVASSSITRSLGNSSPLAIESFTSRGPPSTAATSFDRDVSGLDVPKPKRPSLVPGTPERDPFAWRTSDGEEGTADLDEPEQDQLFDTPQADLVSRFQRTVLSPVLQSAQGSEASEQEEQEIAQLSGFFNDPGLDLGLEHLVQEEAEGFGSEVEENIKIKPESSVPMPGGDSSTEYEDEVTLDEGFEAELARLLPSVPVHPFETLPFQIQFEATRVALSNGAPTNNCGISTHLSSYCDRLYDASTYAEISDILREYSPHTALERSAESTWNEFRGPKGWRDNLYMTGRVYTPNLKPLRSDPVSFCVVLNPLSRSKGCRFYNRFGSDRFLTLRLPSFSDRNMSRQLLEERLINWLVDGEVEILNRSWRCFYLREGKSKKRRAPDDKTFVTETFVQAVFFAVKGAGIGKDEEEMVRLGFRGLDKKLRGEMSVEDLLRWHVPFEDNSEMTIPKFWSRISLGFSDTTPSFRFQQSQIKFVKDIKSPTTGEIMNDGCSVVSPAVMQRVREILELDETPTAVQARLGGAKGVWMVDPRVPWSSDEIFIEVTESQLKYKGYPDDDDWARLTLDVLYISHEPVPTAVNNQLIPILEDRGVPFEALKQLLEEHLEEDLDELFRIFDSPVELRKWIYDRGSVAGGRMASKNIPHIGSRPTSNYEMSIMLLESGFEVRTCSILMESVRKMIDEYCEILKAKLHIRIPHSTTLLCVADPTGTLREGEVSLRFSTGFLDPKTLRRSQVIVGDVLVARNPAHVPSDIQKVRAVDIADYHNPALRELQNVIVFSVQGDRSLASLLSGGDYDGDKPWVCWEERLVEPFENSPTTFDEVDGEVKPWFSTSREKVKDLDPGEQGFFGRFLRAGLRSSLQENLLGQCTSIWEKHCYEKGCISDAGAVKLAKLCSLLVDAPKQGMSLLPAGIREMKKYGGGPTPAYKEGKSRGRSGWSHIIDKLHFEVADPKVMEKQTAFHNDVGGNKRRIDKDLSAIYWREMERAEKDGQKSPLFLTLGKLNQELTKLKREWTAWLSGSSDGAGDLKAGVSHLFQRYRGIKPDMTGDHIVISRWASDGDDPYSEWSLLRASTAYSNWNGERGLLWYMAGQELCHIKCHAVGKGEPELWPRTMLPCMHLPLMTSKKFMSERPPGVSRADEIEFCI